MWTGNLKLDSFVAVNIGQYLFTTGRENITVMTSNPNGGIDAYSGNDKGTKLIKVNPLPDQFWNATLSANGSVVFSPRDNNAIYYFWYFGDNDSSVLKNPVYTFKRDGTYKVRLILSDDSLCIAEYDSSITISDAGIPMVNYSYLSLHISPNPFTTSLSISYTLLQNQEVQLIITDITGKEIATLANENQTSGQHTYTLDADKYSIPAGIYFLRMVAGNEAVEEKIIRLK